MEEVALTQIALRSGRYLVRPGSKVNLSKWNPSDTSGFEGDKGEGEKAIDAILKKIDPLQELLYAEHKHRVLVVLQGMDTSGKDAIIRRVFEGVNPEGVRVAHFGRPSEEDLDHDYLWRAHRQVPGRGELVIFNRSQYESVLVERVHAIVPQNIWSRRYKQIADFERMLSEEGTTILKFFLHISKGVQARRLKDRLEDPTKQWKYNIRDYDERPHWKEYMRAYGETIEKTSTSEAPWYIVPSDHGWYRDLMVAQRILTELRALGMKYPKLVGQKQFSDGNRSR